MGTRRKEIVVDSARHDREIARKKVLDKVLEITNDIIDQHMPHLVDANTDRSGHLPALEQVRTALEKRLGVAWDYRHARRHLTKRVDAYNRANSSNLLVPASLSRFRPFECRKSTAWCHRRRDLKAAHEKLMDVLRQPTRPILQVEEWLGLLLYFSVTLGGLGDPRAVSALRRTLEAGGKFQAHAPTRLVWIDLYYLSRGACNISNDGQLSVYRPWLVPTACRLPLLAYFRHRDSDGLHEHDHSDFSLIKQAFRKISSELLPIKSFSKFCRAGSAVYERQAGIDIPEVLISVANGDRTPVFEPRVVWEI